MRVVSARRRKVLKALETTEVVLGEVIMWGPAAALVLFVPGIALRYAIIVVRDWDKGG